VIIPALLTTKNSCFENYTTHGRNIIAIEPATGIMHPPMRHLNSQQKF
jgi:hypothetical protein